MAEIPALSTGEATAEVSPKQVMGPGARVRVIQDGTPRQALLGKLGTVTRACPATVHVRIDGQAASFAFERWELELCPHARAGAGRGKR